MATQEHPTDDQSNEMTAPNDCTNSGKEATAEVEAHSQTKQQATQDLTVLPSYPGALTQVFLVVVLMLAMFLVSLDMSIIATAIPTITRDFHSVDQVGWYGSAFFMCLAMFQGAWGKGYKYFSPKAVFLTCIFIFEVGSMVVALAPNSLAIIAGRAVQGLGGSGISSGTFNIAALIVRPAHLPTVTGLFGAVYACASALGPVLGGVFTQDVTWRWCFWINLPLGGVTFLVILLFFRTLQGSGVSKTPPWTQCLRELDIPGVGLGLGAWVCLLLVLQEGGTQHTWDSGFSIGLLVGFCFFVIAFIIVEWIQGDTAMIPVRLLKNRTLAACAIYNFVSNGGGTSRIYTLPIYFQAVRGVAPSDSGVRTLASVLSISLASLSSSILLGKVGYYQPFLWTSGILLTVGSGLYYSLDENSSAGAWTGYQIIAGIGMGLSIQLPTIVAQRFTPRQDMSVAVGIIMFTLLVGGGFGISIGQAILNNRLIDTLPTSDSAVTAARVLAAGATGLRQAFTNPQELATVVASYLIGLKAAWMFSTIMSGIAFVTAFAAEWRSINEPRSV